VFDRLRALSAEERRSVARAALALATAITIVKFAGVRRALTWAHCALRRTARSKSADDAAVRAVDRAARYVPGSTCLIKSLALARVLRAEGRAAVVRLGTVRGDDFGAHAWVEADGVALTSARGSVPLPDAVSSLQETGRPGDQEK